MVGRVFVFLEPQPFSFIWRSIHIENIKLNQSFILHFTTYTNFQRSVGIICNKTVKEILNFNKLTKIPKLLSTCLQ